MIFQEAPSFQEDEPFEGESTVFPETPSFREDDPFSKENHG
jgi:hypothetical protein